MPHGQVYTPFAGYSPGSSRQLFPADTNLEQAAGEGPWPRMLNPGNPLFWFMALAAATLGLVAVSGNVRLGKAKVTGSIGEA